MNCPNCGASNAPGAKFCVGCGANIAAQQNPQQNTQQNSQQQYVQQQQQYVQQQQQYVAPQQPAPKKAGSKVNAGAIKAQMAGVLGPIGSKVKSIFSNKMVLFGAIGCVAVLLVLAIVCAIFGGNNGFIEQKSSITVQKTDKEEYSVIVNKKVLSTTIDSKSAPQWRTSLDGKNAAILSSEKELYGVSGKKIKEIASDVIDFKLSNNGKYVAYVTAETKDSKTVYTLHLAKVSSGKSKEISDDIGSNADYVISPDGKSVAYFVPASESGKKAELMYFKGKKSVEVSNDGGTLYGMSDNGKQIYVKISGEGTNLYCYKKNGDREKLGELTGSVGFNSKHTQVMFSGKDGKMYFSNKGKEAEKLVNDSSLNLVYPSGYSDANATGENTLPVTNLLKHVYSNNDNELWMIKKNDKSTKLVSKATSAQLDASGKYVYYIYDGDELRCIKASHGDKASEKYKTIVKDDVSKNYVVTSNRKFVYFIYDGALYSVNGKKGGTPREITEDLSSVSLALSRKDRVYYIQDGDLYACSNGKKGSKVLSDVQAAVASGNGNVYAISDDTFYGTTGAKKLKKLCELG
ncbi:MAG: hypothetical protein IJV82_01990 [Oscillospiraceae bacterium]|nr:hypothetical protein [Oscillospiraceae bacterium]